MPPAIGFSSVKTGITCSYSHSHIASGPFSPVSLLPAGSVFIVFLTHLVGFACSYPLVGAVFLVFPCPSLIVFSPFSLSSGAALPRLPRFPFVSLPVVACRVAVRYRFSPVPVLSPVSSCVPWCGETVLVSWCGCSFRGVALLGWRGVLPFRLASRSLSVRWAGRFGWFFHMELLGGLFVRSDAEAKRFICGGKDGVSMCSLLPSSLVWLYIYFVIDYIYHFMLACFHSSHHLYQFLSSFNPFNSFKDFARPPLACSSLVCGSWLVPPPPGVGGAGDDDDCVAGVDDWSGRGLRCSFRSFASWLIRCSAMISERGRRRLRREAMCG